MTTKNERQAHQLLAKTAGAAQVARMADGTLACSGRDGQLAEPVAYPSLHPFCNVCGWRKGGIDSWDGRRCKCGLREPAMPKVDA